MRSIVVLLPLALAGCPPPTQYLIADVGVASAGGVTSGGGGAGRVPVVDALVAADCRRSTSTIERREAATRTDETGRARLELHGSQRADRCTVVIAKPGLRTVETDVFHLCTTPACPPLVVDLLPPYAPYEQAYGGRDFATPPPGGPR